MYGIYSIYSGAFSDKGILLAYCNDVSSFGFFKRSPLKEMMKFSARESSELIEMEKQYALEIQDKICYCKKDFRRISIFVFCHNGFDQKIAIEIQRKFLLALINFVSAKNIVLAEIKQDLNIKHEKFKEILSYGNSQFKFDTGKKLTKKEQITYDDKSKGDVTINQLNRKVEENKEIVRKNLLKLLEDNGDIDELIRESLDLKNKTKLFLRKSEKMNRCSC